MFADEFLAATLSNIVGTVVTIIGVWLVVRQLHETKLASQMEGMMEISERFAAFNRSNKELVNMVTSDDWYKLSDKEAHAMVFDSRPAGQSWSDVLSLYELTGVLVRRRALDKGIANDYLGYMISIWWKRLEKVNRQQAAELGVEKIGKNWEWLAKEFEKISD